MEPVSNIGKLGRIFLFVLGIIILIFGIRLISVQNQVRQTETCTATITAFSQKKPNLSISSDPEPKPITLVSYTFNGKEYKNIELGQFEANWEIGDTITIYCNPDNPADIQTVTMSYSGWIIVLLSIPFILISSYMLLTMNGPRKKRTPSEIAEDEERTTKGKLKYKVSSIVIPLSAGIPVTTMGLILLFCENQSALAWLALILGCLASAAGIHSVIMYFVIKYSADKEN